MLDHRLQDGEYFCPVTLSAQKRKISEEIDGISEYRTNLCILFNRWP